MKKIFLLLLLLPFSVKAYSTSASTSILMDMDNNRIIYGNNIHDPRPVASISKIMTALLAVESGKMNDIVVVKDEILASYGSGIYIKQGEEISLESLVYGLMLRSGNDAAFAIARYVGSDKFVEMMNNKAKEIGMKNTTFNNPNGLDDKGGNISTAYDMAILTSYAMKNESYRKIVSTKKYTVKTNMNYYSWINKHKLLYQKSYITGGKTGFTDVAKRTLVTTASKDNINLVVVTLNDGNDFKDHIDLFEEAFESHTNYRILNKGYIDIIDEKYYSKDKLYIKNDYYTTLSNYKNNQVTLHFKLDRLSSFKNGDRVGAVLVDINGEVVHEENIYVLKNEKKSIWTKIKDWINNLW